nr:hypothetical protein [Tanacetum cinerariifolium]
MNAKKLQIQKCKVQEVKASDVSSGDKDSSGIVSDKGNDQNLENQINTSGDESNRQLENMNDTSLMEKVDNNTTPDSSDMCNNEFKDDQNADNPESERAVLDDLIANFKFDIDENKKVQKQLRNVNTSLTQELKECKSNPEETTRTLGESNSTRDSCLITLQNREIKLEKYMTYLNRTTEYDTLESILKETQAVLAQKEYDIKKVELSNLADESRAPTAKDMAVLVETCLMPLAIKTQNDSFDICERKTRKRQNQIKTGQKQEACRGREKFKAVIVGERKTRKGQNQIKTGQKQEACRGREKFKAVIVGERKPRKGQNWIKNEKRGEAGKILKQLQ